MKHFFFFGGNNWPYCQHIVDAIRPRLPNGEYRFHSQDALRAKPSLDMQGRAEKALQDVQTRAVGASEIVLMGRSTGAQIATMIADRASLIGPPVKVLVFCYPFKHPDREEEPARYAHLAAVHTPTLIIQGRNDEYGCHDLDQRYGLAKSISIHFTDGTHSLALRPAQWDALWHERLHKCLAG